MTPNRNSYCKMGNEMRVLLTLKKREIGETGGITTGNCSIYRFFGDKTLTLEPGENTNILDGSSQRGEFEVRNCYRNCGALHFPQNNYA